MTTTESKNSNLHAARRAANDEFYTRIEDIEAELWHYRDHFRGKTVYLNCDDPRWSAFWRYFCLRFGELGLERLIATHYTGVTDPGQPSFKIEALRGRDDTAGDGIKYVDPATGGVQTALEGDGDFRSDECVELLKQADVVVTNPPFSLFREYVAQLVEYDKKFVIIGNNNAVTYKEIWPLIQGGKLWLGVTRVGVGQMYFQILDDHPVATGQIVKDGVRLQTVGNTAWFTNLDHARRHDEVPLFRRYSDNPAVYPKYENFDAIEVGRVANIPIDYEGNMGVPITFLGKHNPDQFEIVGDSRMVAEPMSVDGKVIKDVLYSKPDGTTEYPYRRIIIRRKK